jgi:hypothetical protein
MQCLKHELEKKESLYEVHNLSSPWREWSGPRISNKENKDPNPNTWHDQLGTLMTLYDEHLTSVQAVNQPHKKFVNTRQLCVRTTRKIQSKQIKLWLQEYEDFWAPQDARCMPRSVADATPRSNTKRDMSVNIYIYRHTSSELTTGMKTPTVIIYYEAPDSSAWSGKSCSSLQRSGDRGILGPILLSASCTRSVG